MSSDVDSDNVEYVEYLEGDYEGEHEIVTANEENLQQIEYVEAQQISNNVEFNEEGYPQLDGHTVFEHNGQQYMIPNELHQSGQTIVLENYNGEEEQEFVLNVDSNTEVVTNNIEYVEAEEGTSDHLSQNLPTGRQYAVLRDGKFHIEGSGGEDKLQELQQTLGLDDPETEQIEEQIEVTGKNLITGESISLNGFLEKLKRRVDKAKRDCADDTFYPEIVKKQRRSFYNHEKEQRFSEVSRPDYVLMPPINKKVLVGKTSDGKNIVGKILQIWKKVDNSTPPPKPNITRKKPQPKILTKEKPKDKIEELIIDSTGQIVPKETQPKNMKKKYVSKAFLDQNIAKTLNGLMELESIKKSLAHKNLVIKHILKKSIQGKIQPGKEVTYFYGHMEMSEIQDELFEEIKTQWKFISDYEENPSTGIDLNESNDRQQVDISADGKVTFGSLSEPDLAEVWSTTEGKEKQKRISEQMSETVPVNLIVIEDEYGRKRTKVTIPQLAGQKVTNRRQPIIEDPENLLIPSNACPICPRIFVNQNSLRRHIAAHVTSDENSTANQPTTINRRYACATCGKEFNRHSNMLRHSEIHRQPVNQQQVYSCDICGSHYNFISSLTRHVVNNHMKQEEENNDHEGKQPIEFVEVLQTEDLTQDSDN